MVVKRAVIMVFENGTREFTGGNGTKGEGDCRRRRWQRQRPSQWSGSETRLERQDGVGEASRQAATWTAWSRWTVWTQWTARNLEGSATSHSTVLAAPAR